MMRFFKYDDVIDSLIGLQPPPEAVALARQKRVEAVKLSMGDKYLLAIPVERK